MKKTIKTIISIILAALMAAGSLTAFADEADKSIIWNETEYTYAGELEEGSQKISTTNENTCFYFNFNAENAGYYLFSYDYLDFYGVSVPESVNDGVANGLKDRKSSSKKTTGTDLYYLEKGVNVIGVRNPYDTKIEKASLKIEFLGDKVADISYDQAELTDLILNYDCMASENAGVDELVFYPSIAVTFSSGKTINYDYYGVDAQFENGFEPGEHEITIDFFDYSEQATFSAYPITHFVKKAELANLDDYTVLKRYYDNDDDYNKAIESETLTVTFADNSTESYNLSEGWTTVTLPNGRKCDAHIRYHYLANKPVQLEILVASHVFASYDCTYSESDVCGNIENLHEKSNNVLEYEKEKAEQSFLGLFSSGSFGEYIENLFGVPKSYINAIVYIIGEYIEFVLHYAGSDFNFRSFI